MTCQTVLLFIILKKKPTQQKLGRSQVDCLSSKVKYINAAYLTKFLSGLLPSIIFHRNQLKCFRNGIISYRENFECLIDTDFLKILKISLKYEPQSAHWNFKQVTIHSGILKNMGQKSHYSHLSDNKKCDHVFSDVVLQRMLNPIPPPPILVIETDNCASQCKSAAHFYCLQFLSERKKMKIVRVYGIVGHVKQALDHVGGMIKEWVWWEVAAGQFFIHTDDMIEFLAHKFSNHFFDVILPRRSRIDGVKIPYCQ